MLAHAIKGTSPTTAMRIFDGSENLLRSDDKPLVIGLKTTRVFFSFSRFSWLSGASGKPRRICRKSRFTLVAGCAIVVPGFSRPIR